MMLKGGSGGTGRDVIFRLVAESAQGNKQAFAQFGNEIAATQKKITTASTQEVKKRADEEVKQAKKTGDTMLRERMKHDKQVATSYLKEHFRAIDDRVKGEKKAEEELAKWRQRLRSNSIQLEYQQNLKAIQQQKRQESEMAEWRQRVRQNSTRMAEQIERREARQHVLADRRFERGLHATIGGVGNIARGAAYSGLIGSTNSEHVLNTVLGVEAAGSAYRGGRSLLGGIGALSSGGSASGAAALAAGGTVAAAFAAVAASAAALTSAFFSARDASEAWLRQRRR
jgi:hypothetical protein